LKKRQIRNELSWGRRRAEPRPPCSIVQSCEEPDVLHPACFHCSLKTCKSLRKHRGSSWITDANEEFRVVMRSNHPSLKSHNRRTVSTTLVWRKMAKRERYIVTNIGRCDEVKSGLGSDVQGHTSALVSIHVICITSHGPDLRSNIAGRSYWIKVVGGYLLTANRFGHGTLHRSHKIYMATLEYRVLMYYCPLAVEQVDVELLATRRLDPLVPE